MVWRRLAVPIAGLLGPLIIAAVVLRNWHGWAAAPFWLDDIAAGLLLIAAAIFAYNEQDSLRGRLLTGALSVAVAVLWGSLFESLAGLHPRPEEWSATPGVALTLTVIAFLLAVAGVAFSLPSKRRPFVGTRPEKQKTRR
jgi:peptidoglycan/LPS O-acetylase OafA/YrhL